MKTVKINNDAIPLDWLAEYLREQLKEKELVSFMDMLGHGGDWSLELLYIKKILKDYASENKEEEPIICKTMKFLLDIIKDQQNNQL